MKLLLFTILSTLFMFHGCDAPRESRFGQSELQNSDPFFQDSINDQEQNPDPNWGSGNPGTDLIQQPGYENCLIGPRYGSSNTAYGGEQRLGRVGVCRNEQSLNEFLLSFSAASAGDQSCVQPMHDAGGRSFYVGQEKCITHQANSVHSFVLGANRPGYENRAINLLVVYRMSSKAAFYSCMDSFALTVRQSAFCRQNKDPYGFPNQACLQYAAQAQAQVCASFKRNHNYIKVPL